VEPYNKYLFNSVDEAHEAAYYCFTFSDSFWINRRVETISFIDQVHWSHHVSLDIDSKKLFLKRYPRITNNAESRDADSVIMPLGYFQRGLIFDLHVKDCFNNSLQVLTNTETEQYLELALLGCVDEYVKNRTGEFYQNMRQLIHKWMTDPSAQDTENELAKLYAENRLFRKMLLTMFNNSILVIRMHKDQSPIVEYDFIDTSSEILKLKQTTNNLIALPLGTARREHLHLSAPNGMEIVKKPAICDAAGNEVLPPHGFSYERKTTPLLQSFYVHQTDDAAFLGIEDRFTVSFTMRPREHDFLLISLACTFVTFCISIVLILHIYCMHIGWLNTIPKCAFSDPQSAVTILLLVSSFYFVNLVQRDEHAVRRTALTIPRYLITAPLIGSGFGALFLVIKWVWVIPALLFSTITSSLILISLLIWHYHGKYLRNRIAETMQETEHYDSKTKQWV